MAARDVQWADEIAARDADIAKARTAVSRHPRQKRQYVTDY
jgi:hypothetical protein